MLSHLATIHAVYPHAVGLLGGARITITGDGFSGAEWKPAYWIGQQYEDASKMAGCPWPCTFVRS